MRNKLVILFLCVFSLLFPQNKFQYKAVDPALKNKIAVTDIERNQIKNQCFKQAKDLTAYLPSSYDKTGNTDYTDFLQKGLNENSLVIMPDFPVQISPKGLQLKSNSKVLFQKSSQLKVKANDKEFYAAINAENIENVTVYFANLLGERYQHQSDKGEWGMGIYIIHSQNINIQKPTITKFWGDGIYIGKMDGINSQNITINGAFIDENRRNGISIIAGDQINITNCLISNTYGTIPEYGIDIEPNKPEDDLRAIVLSNNTTFNNNKGGLLFALDNLQGKQTNEITIQVNNQTDYYSEKAIEFYIDRGYQKYLNPLRGSIIINGANLYYNKTPIISNDSKPAKIKLNINNIKNNNVKIDDRKMNNFVNQFQQGKKQVIQ
ncbi:MAG: right-handed parallel beta-helix repeat-containing protein [Flavobacteriales bacterium]|nr:right-handed parallel beta-helix repeat-containing protein [Flavobacteriales bacterium]